MYFVVSFFVSLVDSHTFCMYVTRMKAITVNVPNPVYQAFQEYARENDRTASELIREALEAYRQERMQPRQSLANLPPLSLGDVLRPLNADDDLLEEMTHA